MRAALVLSLLVGLTAVARADAPADVRVIVAADSHETKLDKHTVAELFLKKRTRWDDDHAVLPVDLKQDNHVREKFSKEVLGRDVASVRRYWAQLVFSGRGVPPPELESDAEVIKYVASHAGAIGYVSAGAKLDGVKAVEVE
jgi:ABC-type phosphate transport system substrate-binding protein